MISDSDDAEANCFQEWSPDLIGQLGSKLSRIEGMLKTELETLEKSEAFHSPEEIFEEEPPPTGTSLLDVTNRIVSILKRHNKVEEIIVKENSKLRKQLKDQQFLIEEIEMQRDVLLQQVHTYLEANSSLRVRLEEQRCQTGSLQRQLNTDLELRIKSLQNEKEQLSDLNMEKDKQIHKMTVLLEQTAKGFEHREMEVLNWKNEENNLKASLKADLEKALKEKAKMEEKYTSLKERFEDYFLSKSVEGLRRNSMPKRSLSVGDFSLANLNFLEKNFIVEPDWDFRTDGQCTLKVSKNISKPKATDDPASNPWRLHESRSWPTDVTSPPRAASERLKSLPVHTQLNAIRRDLLSVTKKLEALKCQLIISGVIPKEVKSKESRSLKRKGNPIEEANVGISEEPKSEFKNLKNILEDAKNLNVKLQNLREEKQRIIDQENKKEEEAKEPENKNDEFSHAAHETGLSAGIFKSR